MLAKPTAQKTEKLWPSLAANSKSSSNSFFGDKKSSTQVAAIPTPSEDIKKDEVESDGEECKVPAYKNNFSDALADALKSASLNESSPGSSGKKSKKKAKKTLLFSSGMNFN